MKKFFKLNLLYGLLLWFVPFLTGFVLFPLRSSDRIFFEGIMFLFLVFSVGYSVVKLREAGELSPVRTGILWLVMCLVLDQAFFSWGPQAMSFVEYWKSIGIDYLTIPLLVFLGFTPIKVEEKAEEGEAMEKELPAYESATEAIEAE